jgi:hypothetical protein
MVTVLAVDDRETLGRATADADPDAMVVLISLEKLT